MYSLITTFLVSAAMGCLCMPSTFCENLDNKEYVFRAEILEDKGVKGTSNLFSVKVISVFKAPSDVKAGDILEIDAPAEEFGCGRNPIPGEDWYLDGLSIQPECMQSKFWSEVTDEEKSQLDAGTCKITNTTTDVTPTTDVHGGEKTTSTSTTVCTTTTTTKKDAYGDSDSKPTAVDGYETVAPVYSKAAKLYFALSLVLVGLIQLI